jgi:hypothetical protein
MHEDTQADGYLLMVTLPQNQTYPKRARSGDNQTFTPTHKT